MEIEVSRVFSTPISLVKVGLTEEERESLISLSENLDYYHTGASLFKETLSQKSYNEFVLKDKNFISIKEKFLKAVIGVKNTVFKYSTTDIDMSTSWVTKSEFGQGSDYHNHKNCWLSSCYYFGSNQFSKITFLINRLDSYMFEADSFNEYNITTYEVTPSNDLLIIFPSYLTHRITPQEYNQTRYSLACNYIPVNSYGVGDSRVA